MAKVNFTWDGIYCFVGKYRVGAVHCYGMHSAIMRKPRYWAYSILPDTPALFTHDTQEEARAAVETAVRDWIKANGPVPEITGADTRETIRDRMEQELACPNITT